MSDGKVVFDITGNTSGINSALNAATNSIAQQTAKWTVLGQTAMNALVGAAKAGFNAIKDIAKIGFEYNAQMETYKVNFTTLLGSAEAAQAKMAELTEYAAKTPFAMSDLADATQTMLAFGLTSEESALALKQLGDISLGDANKLSSLTLAFSQVSSAGKLAGQDLLQMINAGFNPLKVIAEETGVAYADLKAVMSGEKTSDDFQIRMEAARKEVAELGVNASESAIMLAQIGEDGMISADMVAAAMRIATSEGGAFFNALQNASETTQGQISTLQDGWNMLVGNVTGGAFDSLSTSVLPQLITWVDELNKAFDENGFEGLRGAAGGIFDELGTLAFNAGAGLLTQLYNGLTGSETTTEEVKGVLSEIFGVAGEAVSGMKEIGLTVLEWVKDNGALVSKAATLIGVGFAVMTLATNPLALALTAAASAIAVFTVDWDSFAEKYPNFVAAFEEVAGIDFSTFTASIESCRTNVSAFYNDCIAPVVEGLNSLAGSETSGLGGLLLKLNELGSWFGGVGLVQHWADIKTAVSDAATAVSDFFTQTVPEAWTTFCSDVSSLWTTYVVTPIDNAVTAIADLLGIEVPEDWSLTKKLEESFKKVLAPIREIISSVKALFGIDDEPTVHTPTAAQQEYIDEMTAAAEAETRARAPSKYAGKYAHLAEDVRDEMLDYVWRAIENGSQNGIGGVDSDLVSPELFRSLQEDVADALSSGDFSIEIAETWFEDAESDLQGQLNRINNLTVSVTAALSDRFDPAGTTFGPPVFGGLTGRNAASGGLFTSATQLLGEDGMHTFGESGTEVLLPLDALWRKMGMIFDHTFASNLAGLQYNIMPQLPAAMPTFAGFDEDKLSAAVASSVKEAVSGLTVEMDKKKVGRIVAPEVSREMANEVNGRKWTA